LKYRPIRILRSALYPRLTFGLSLPDAANGRFKAMTS
jgi:hypothetical protein